MNEFNIDFPHNLTTFDPGAEISLNLSWHLESSPEVIEVRLVWNTSGKGDRDLKVVKTVRFDRPSPNGQQHVVLELPWGPYSFSGKLISLTWAVEVIALPSESSYRQEIIVAPRGQEVLIAR